MPAGGPAAAGRAGAHAARRRDRGRRGRRRRRAGARGPRGRRRGRRDQRVDAPPAARSSTGWPADRVHVAAPGVDAADLAPGTPAGGAAALRRGGDARQGPRRAARGARDDRRPALALRAASGSLDRDPAFVADLRRRARDAGLGRPGARSPGRAPAPSSTAATPPPTCSCCASRAETVRHGRHRGAGPRPARSLATEVGGVPEALGHGADGSRPGLLVAARRPGRARRRAARPGSATPSCAARCARAARERRASLRRLGGHDVRVLRGRARAERRDDRRATTASARSGSRCASPPTRRPALGRARRPPARGTSRAARS